ncbi:MAG: hypothetical protein U0Q18_04490 [Bryobacteraceae bacterium]
MTKKIHIAVALMAAAFLLQQGNAQDKNRTLKVQLHYTGSGTVDDKHKIVLFLFDSPEFVSGGVMPFNMKTASSKDEIIVFEDAGKSPVYAATIYDPKGEYDGQSGPPSGASLGMYGQETGKPVPINIEEGKTVTVDLPFDDTAKMP